MKRFNPIRNNKSLNIPPPIPPGCGGDASSPKGGRDASSPKGARGVTCSFNTEKSGIELRFTDKPSDAVRAQLKAAGFRWGFKAKCWYVKDTPEKRAWVQHFLSTNSDSSGPGVSPVKTAGVSPAIASGAATIPGLNGCSILGMKNTTNGHHTNGHTVKPPTRKQALVAAAKLKLDCLRHFIGHSQRQCVLDALRGEEWEFFADKLTELACIITEMPCSGDAPSPKGGRDASSPIAHLHYFVGGQANFYITEKDASAPDDAANGVPPQSQAFGLADLFGDGGEIGYISIAEILENGGELDFYWTPKTLAEIRGGTDNETGPKPEGGLGGTGYQPVVSGYQPETGQPDTTAGGPSGGDAPIPASRAWRLRQSQSRGRNSL